MSSADLVVFGEDWGRHPSATQHLVMRLSERRRVLWMNSIGMRRPRMTLRDISRVAGKLAGMVRGKARPPVDNGGDGVSVFSPLAVSWPGSRAVSLINRTLLTQQIGRLMSTHGIRRPLLWTSLPTALPVVGGLGERASVYYCGDDFSALAGVDHGPVAEMEAALVARVDLVLAASEQLAARFPRHKTLLAPHGADTALFSAPVRCAVDLPVGRPIAGFYGSIAAWIDIGLLCDVADRLPDWQFVFIGAVETDVSSLVARPNVTLLGPRPHHALPSYSQHWTASLLPFRDCAQIRACNPLKLREYLAAGRPIVTTDFPALAGYRDCVTVANDSVAFAEALKATLADNGTCLRKARVAGETWEARATTIAAALDAL